MTDRPCRDCGEDGIPGNRSCEPSGAATPLEKARGRTSAGGIVIAVVLAAFLMALQPVSSADVWHHVKCGWLVAQNHGPVRADVFSCTATGQRWVQYEWLAQLAMYAVHEAGGTAGLLLFRAVGVAAAALLLLLTCRARKLPWPAAAAAVLFALCAASGRFFSRPEIFTFVLLPCLMLAVEKIRTGRHRLMFVPAIVMIPWVNMHGAWVGGLAWVGLVCGGETIRYLVKRDGALPKGTLLALWIALLAAAAATLVNPYGAHIWEVPFKLSATAEVRSAIMEWQRPDMAFWLQARHVGALLLLVLIAAAPRRVSPADALVALFFGILSLTARRHLAFAMCATAPLFAGQLSALWPRETSASRLKAFLSRPRVGSALILLLCAVLVVVALGGPGLPRAGFGVDDAKYPIGAARFLKRAQLGGNIFNSYAFGNYLLYALYPQNRVFIDGRVDMYGAEPVRLYDAVRRAQPEWRDILQEHSVEICVLETTRKTDAPLLNALHAAGDWALAYWDDNAAVYVQHTENKERFLGETHVYHVRPDESYVPAAPSGSDVERAQHDFAAKLKEDPDCVLALQGLAECLRMKGSHDDASKLLRRAVELQPGNAALAYNLGACLLAVGNLDEAERQLHRAIRLGAYRMEAHKALGAVFYSKGDSGKAIRSFEKALRHSPAGSPRRWEIYWNIARVHEEAGRPGDAVRALETANRLSPNQPAVLQKLRALKQASSGKAGGTP